MKREKTKRAAKTGGSLPAAMHSIENSRPDSDLDSNLSEGWRIVPLPAVCELNPPKPDASAVPAEASVSFVPVPAVDADLGAITTATSRPFASVRKGGFTAFRDGDVIMAKITVSSLYGKHPTHSRHSPGVAIGDTGRRPDRAAQASRRWLCRGRRHNGPFQDSRPASRRSPHLLFCLGGEGGQLDAP